MLRHLDAIYEHGVLRPLEPLALPEHQRVRLTLDEGATAQGDGPSIDRHNELCWLAKDSGPYAGEWVALDGNRLIAHGQRLAVVRAEAKAKTTGLAEPFFARVPRDRDLPFGGW